MILAAVTAVLASSFLFRSAQEAKLANRSYFQAVALNLAEAGIEEALHAINSAGLTTANSWTLAAGDTDDYVKTITGFPLTQGTGTIYIRVDEATDPSPVVIVTGVVTLPNQPRILKQLRVRGAFRRYWANGIVAKDTITFVGKGVADSYDSANGAYNATTNRSDYATIASASTATAAVDLDKQATVYGYVATGGGDPDVGVGGRIYGLTTPSGTLVDPTRIRKDFSANLSDVSAPTGTAISLGAVSATVTLPRAGDTVGANGRYLYTSTGLNLNSSEVIIQGPVDLIVAGNISVGNAGSVTVGSATHPTASLNLYLSGDAVFSTKGFYNHVGDASKLLLFGTAPTGTTQTISIANDNDFTGLIYAPNCVLTLDNKGDVFGAVIAKAVTVKNKATFHYDVQLANLSDRTVRVVGWTELTKSPGSGHAFARDTREPFASLF